MRTRFATDSGLTRRMVATMAALGLLHVAFIAVLIALGVRAVAVLVVAGVLLLAQYFLSDRVAPYAMRGREVPPQEAPELHGVVDRLSAPADMPKPRVAIADSDVPDAFATGRDHKNAVVRVTTGLLRRLEPQELEGVLAQRPSALAAALAKISGEMGRIPTRDLREAEPFNAFFFAPTRAGGAAPAALFSTRPPLERRLDQLAKISNQLGRG